MRVKDSKGKFTAFTEQDAKIAFELKHKNYNYVSGYTHCESTIIIECKMCKTKFNRNASCIRKNKVIRSCIVCVKSRKENERQTILIARENKRKQKELLKIKECVCKQCDKQYITVGKNIAFCSTKCRNKYFDKQKETKRRLSILVNGDYDKSITLEKLIIRDKSKCHICNIKVNTDDYRMDNGIFIAGKTYPSIDHIKPISKGGTHEWANIMLAHFYCNTIKRDKDTFETSSGQVTFAI